MEEVSFYREYADRALENLNADRYFETIVICSIGLDVILNTLPDRLRLFSSDRLKDYQKEVLSKIQQSQVTAGVIISKLSSAGFLDRRLIRALERLNRKRNKIIHPLQASKMKPGKITPSSVDKASAEKTLRLFFHVIDLAAGRSPRKEKKQLRQYIQWRKKISGKHFPNN